MILTFLVGLSACGQAALPRPETLWVDLKSSGQPISPYVFGVNHGPWAVLGGDLLEQAKQIPINYIRFPGGNWGEDNNLRSWHIDTLIALCRELNAEPQISVRLRGGTPQAAAELVHYVNVEKGYDVRYWSIGNEPELYRGLDAYADYDTARYNREWRAVAEAMLAVDPEITLLGPEVTQFTGNPATDPKDQHGSDWVSTFLQRNGDLVDIVAIHRYPFPLGMAGNQVSPDVLLANPDEWNAIIPKLREMTLQYTGRELPLAITEINSYWTNALGGETTPDSFLSALWWADVLGRLIEQDVEIVAYFSLQSNNSIGGYGLFSRNAPRPAYYVYKLYREFGRYRLPTKFEDNRLSFYAARRVDGAVSLLVINRSAETVEKIIQLSGAQPAGQARVWLFDQQHKAEEIKPVDWKAETTVTLPPYSASMFVVPVADK